jgi:hypothetical protein
MFLRLVRELAGSGVHIDVNGPGLDIVAAHFDLPSRDVVHAYHVKNKKESVVRNTTSDHSAPRGAD